MRKAFLILGLVAVSAAAGGLTAWTVSADRGGSVAYIEREVERTPALGTQFTSYQAEQYPDLTYAAENAVKAVVNIEAIQQVEMPQRRGYDPFLEFFGIPQDYGRGDGGPQYREQRAGGSGVIISEDGYIVTNNHVVDGASKLKVKLNDGRSFDAKLIGKDSATDLALLKVEAKGLPTLAFGSSDALRLGEWVLAIGSPFDLQSTITAGIVSAKARQLGAIPNDFRIESFIQTDAAVNPGNSGGALVNTHGELVGINTLIKSQTGSYVGYSFAIPESIVRKVVVDLKEFGVVQRALLGVQFRVVDQDFLDTEGKELGIKDLGGAYVAAVVEGGAASEAGIRKGDVILDIDGVKILFVDCELDCGELFRLTERFDEIERGARQAAAAMSGGNVELAQEHFALFVRHKADEARGHAVIEHHIIDVALAFHLAVDGRDGLEFFDHVICGRNAVDAVVGLVPDGCGDLGYFFNLFFFRDFDKGNCHFQLSFLCSFRGTRSGASRRRGRR